MSSTMKVLIYGAGDMAGKHAAAYARCEDVTIAAVANRSEARAAKFVESYGIPKIYRDFAEALKEEKPDIVSVCVPTVFHPEAAIQALEAGAHVLTEKPIALRAEDAEKMIETAEKTGRKLSVVFNRRFNTVWEELNRRLPSIGSPVIYNTQEIRSIRPKPAMHSRSMNNGPVIDCCVHDFDMLLHSIGRAKSVFASGTVFGSNKEPLKGIQDFAVDTAHIDVEFEGGSRAYLLYAWGFPEGSDYWQYREYMGPDGIIRMMGEFGGELRHYRSDGSLQTVENLKENGHEVIVGSFVDAVRSDGKVPVTAEDALEALKISLAALRSIESGEREVI